MQEGVVVKKPRAEVLKEAAQSNIWREVIRPELEEAKAMVQDILITMEFEEKGKYTAGEIYLGRRVAAAYLMNVINNIDKAGKENEKAPEDKKKDSFE